MSEVKDYYIEYFDLKKKYFKNQKNFKRLWQVNESLVKRNEKLEAKIQIIENEIGVSVARESKHGFYTHVGESHASEISTDVPEQTNADPLEKITHAERVYFSQALSKGQIVI